MSSPDKLKKKLEEPEFGRAKTLYIWLQGDLLRKYEIHINPNQHRTWNCILIYLTTYLNPVFGAICKLISIKTNKSVNCFKDLEDKGKYMAVGVMKNIKLNAKRYKTDAEIARRKLRKVKKFYSGEVQELDYLRQTKRRKLTVIYVLPNGPTCQPPLKVVLTDYDKERWDLIYSYVENMLDIPSGMRYLCTIYGDKLLDPSEIQHGYVYVAVPYNNKFIEMDYITYYFTDWQDTPKKKQFYSGIRPSDKSNKGNKAKLKQIGKPNIFQAAMALVDDKNSYTIVKNGKREVSHRTDMEKAREKAPKGFPTPSETKNGKREEENGGKEKKSKFSKDETDVEKTPKGFPKPSKTKNGKKGGKNGDTEKHSKCSKVRRCCLCSVPLLSTNENTIVSSASSTSVGLEIPEVHRKSGRSSQSIALDREEGLTFKIAKKLSVSTQKASVNAEALQDIINIENLDNIGKEEEAKKNDFKKKVSIGKIKLQLGTDQPETEVNDAQIQIEPDATSKSTKTDILPNTSEVAVNTDGICVPCQELSASDKKRIEADQIPDARVDSEAISKKNRVSITVNINKDATDQCDSGKCIIHNIIDGVFNENDIKKHDNLDRSSQQCSCKNGTCLNYLRTNQINKYTRNFQPSAQPVDEEIGIPNKIDSNRDKKNAEAKLIEENTKKVGVNTDVSMGPKGTAVRSNNIFNEIDIKKNDNLDPSSEKCSATNPCKNVTCPNYLKLNQINKITRNPKPMDGESDSKTTQAGSTDEYKRKIGVNTDVSMGPNVSDRRNIKDEILKPKDTNQESVKDTHSVNGSLKAAERVTKAEIISKKINNGKNDASIEGKSSPTRTIGVNSDISIRYSLQLGEHIYLNGEFAPANKIDIDKDSTRASSKRSDKVLLETKKQNKKKDKNKESKTDQVKKIDDTQATVEADATNAENGHGINRQSKDISANTDLTGEFIQSIMDNKEKIIETSKGGSNFVNRNGTDNCSCVKGLRRNFLEVINLISVYLQSGCEGTEIGLSTEMINEFIRINGNLKETKEVSNKTDTAGNNLTNWNHISKPASKKSSKNGNTNEPEENQIGVNSELTGEFIQSIIDNFIENMAINSGSNLAVRNGSNNCDCVKCSSKLKVNGLISGGLNQIK